MFNSKFLRNFTHHTFTVDHAPFKKYGRKIEKLKEILITMLEYYKKKKDYSLSLNYTKETIAIVV